MSYINRDLQREPTRDAQRIKLRHVVGILLGGTSLDRSGYGSYLHVCVYQRKD